MRTRPLVFLCALIALGATPLDQVEVTLRPAGRGPQEGIGRGVVDAPPERVFRALSDLDHWDEFMPFLQDADARPQKDGSVLSFQRLDLPGWIGERHYEIRARGRVEGREWILEWSYVPGTGNVRAHRGSWNLTRLGPDRTSATLRLYTDPGGAVPDWAMDRATRKSLGWIFKGLRQHVRRSRYGSERT
jgi:uncharacterized protein YndB with AHSA1/START domain